jgi:hypothetical protein
VRSAASPFIDGKIYIVPPVRLRKTEMGIAMEIHQDGGTKMLTIIDATGRSFDLYMYHRFGREKDWGLYLNGYPEYKGGTRVTNESEFERRVLNHVLKWNRKTGNVSFR